MPDTHRIRTSYPLEFELHMVVNCVSAGTVRVVVSLNPSAISPAPPWLFYKLNSDVWLFVHVVYYVVFVTGVTAVRHHPVGLYIVL